MDVNTLLDFVEELLNMYGYETRRNVGIVGGKVTTAPLEKETGTLGEELPKTEEKEIVYKADILAEKRDIERPFGRIVVRYKRGSSPASAADVDQITIIKEQAEAHSALLLTVQGFTPDAAKSAIPSAVTIITPEKVQELLGKAMTRDKWWFNAPAYPITFDYEKVKWKLGWFFEKMLFINFDCIWFWNKELAYEPYWKFSYHIAPKEGTGGEIKEGFFAINAYTGEIDTWVDIKPELAATVKNLSSKMWFDNEIIHLVESIQIAPRKKIEKPKLPRDVKFLVYKPAMEKHEAKLAAIQWISYVERVNPDDVVITGRELIYHPWWKFFYFYRPVVKNAWMDTEYYGLKMTAIYGDIFNQWKHYAAFQRDIIYYYMERSLIKLFGRDRYVSFMRKVTLGVATLWWNYHLTLKPIYIWALLLLITAGAIYAFVTATTGLSIILGLLLGLIFMGPGYAFLYVLQDYLGRYPSASYPHPRLTTAKYNKEVLPIKEAKTALAELEKLEDAGKLSRGETRELERIRKRHKKELMKKLKKGKKKI